jgi:hypothetical protein
LGPTCRYLGLTYREVGSICLMLDQLVGRWDQSVCCGSNLSGGGTNLSGVGTNLSVLGTNLSGGGINLCAVGATCRELGPTCRYLGLTYREVGSICLMLDQLVGRWDQSV